VSVTHRNIIRLVCATNYLQLTPQDRVAHASNTAFDAATFEIWGALLNGATLVAIPRQVLLTPHEFAARLHQQQISTLFLTTALFNQLASCVPQVFHSLKHVLFGGEAVEPKWVTAVMRHGPPAHLLHVYGPTENTTFSSWYQVPDAVCETSSIPIGQPITNTQLYVLDPRMQPVPVGVVGELFVGGDGLARGYLNRPDLTAERFVPNPFADDRRPTNDQRPTTDEDKETRRQGDKEHLQSPISNLQSADSFVTQHSTLNTQNSRLYKTGDLARWREDGRIEFLGRIDGQVKLRGYRIELGEIEVALGQHPAVVAAVVLLREDAPGDKRLVAYVVPTTDDQGQGDKETRGQGGRGHATRNTQHATRDTHYETPSSILHPPSSILGELRAFLIGKLPAYMIPATWVILDALPLTPNGKVDRRALPAPEPSQAGQGFVAPRTPVEQQLADIWAEMLGLSRVGVHDNFFELGGDSIVAIRILARANTAGLHLEPEQVFQSPTIAQLAALLAPPEPGSQSTASAPDQPSRPGGQRRRNRLAALIEKMDQEESTP
jgi:amino acid adenylation domain-containing protein